jgi:mRNA-degrading endonuclease RelE of RelBE toxin-antitoxin system
MSWAYRFDARALKELRSLGKPAQHGIIADLDERITGDADPRRSGKGLKADLAGLWRYQVPWLDRPASGSPEMELESPLPQG